jgi:NADH dehydrogenase (ubiquinone) 1 alpha/beta subcomplex 1, acyl-carrier protein
MLSKIFAISTRGLTRRLPLWHSAALTTPLRRSFTSSSDPTQVALLEEVEGKVFQVLKSANKCNQAKLSRAATFEELGFDSLDAVELVVAMEEYFGFDIPNEEAEKIATVEAAVNTFYRHLNAKIANKIVENPNETAPK